MKPEHIVELSGKRFVLYAGLLDEAYGLGLKSISVTLVQRPDETNNSTAICAATVETERGTFTEIGDANPTNVSRMMAPHLIRMAATRAKARALRDATNVGMVAVEELGGPGDEPPTAGSPAPSRVPAIRRRDAPQSAPEGGAPIDQRAALLVRYRKLAARALAAGVAVDDVPVLHDDAPADAITAAGKALQERLAALDAPQAG